MSAIVRPKEPFGARKQAVIVFVPTESFARPKSFGNFWFVLDTSGNNFEKAGKKYRASLVSESERLLGRQGVTFCCGVIGNEAAGALRCEPFPDVTFMRFCLGRNFFRGHRP